jgi:hypothetical protein
MSIDPLDKMEAAQAALPKGCHTIEALKSKLESQGIHFLVPECNAESLREDPLEIRTDPL